MFSRRTRSLLEDVNLLDVTPVRLADWEEKEGCVVLERPRSTRRGWPGIADRISYAMSTRRIRLDAVGSFSWKRLDGSSTVAEVARALQAEFGDVVEPAEERLGLFVRTLREQGLLAYPGWDEIPDSKRV